MSRYFGNVIVTDYFDPWPFNEIGLINHNQKSKTLTFHRLLSRKVVLHLKDIKSYRKAPFTIYVIHERADVPKIIGYTNIFRAWKFKALLEKNGVHQQVREDDATKRSFQITLTIVSVIIGLFMIRMFINKG